MKAEMEKIIGAAQVARVERRAKEAGIADIWGMASAAARVEMPEAAPDALARRAAIRAQQIVGLIVREVTAPAPTGAGQTPDQSDRSDTPERTERTELPKNAAVNGAGTARKTNHQPEKR